MINYSARLDSAIKKAAWAHEQAKQHRKGTDIPYIIHPFGVMVIASNVTSDEDVLIGCLMHDIIEDVDATIYSEADINKDFGERVVSIVKDVSKNPDIYNWLEQSKDYLDHLEHRASSEAVIVASADKIHNLLSVLGDYEVVGDELWQRFATKSAADQLWWYESVLEIIKKRGVDERLSTELTSQIERLKTIVN